MGCQLKTVVTDRAPGLTLAAAVVAIDQLICGEPENSNPCVIAKKRKRKKRFDVSRLNEFSSSCTIT